MTSLKQLRAQFPQYNEVSDGDFLFAIRQKYYPKTHPRTFFDAIDGAANAHVTIKQFRDQYKDAVSQPLPDETTDQTARRLSGALEDPVGDAGGKGMAAARSLLQGLTLGGGDEIVARGTSLLTGRDFQDELKREQDRLAIGRDQNPVLSYGSEIAGALALPGVALKGAKAKPIQTAAKSGGLAGLGGLLYGYLSGEGGAANRAENALVSGAIAAPLGAAAPAIGGMLGRAATKRAGNRQIRDLAKSAPDMDSVRAAASAAFSKADATGLPPAGLAGAVQGIGTQISRRPINPKITPKASGVMDELTGLAMQPRTAVEFGELQDVRRLAGAARGDFTNPVEQRAGAIIQRGIDDFVESADPALGKEIAEARKMWSRLRKSEVIDEAVEKARNQASGFENGLRIQLRAILNSKKRRAGFNKDELAVMRQIVEGTKFGNLMKKVGRLSFGMDQQTNVMSGMMGSGIAGAAGASAFGPAGAALGLVPPVLGYGAKKASQKSTETLASGLRGMVATGARAPKQISAIERAMLDELARRAARPAAGLGAPMLTGQR